MATSPEWVSTLVNNYVDASEEAADTRGTSAQQTMAHEARTERTLSQLQERVRQQEADLAKVDS